MPIHSRVLENGSRNVKVLVTGVLECDVGPIEVLHLDTFKCQAMKLESALWIVQEKMGLRLWWGKGEILPNTIPASPIVSPENLLFVMESRNSARFDHGIDSPRAIETWDHQIWMDSFGFTSNEATPKHFTFILEFDKQ